MQSPHLLLTRLLRSSCFACGGATGGSKIVNTGYVTRSSARMSTPPISAALRRLLLLSATLHSPGSTSALIAISPPHASITPPISTCSSAASSSPLPDYETPLGGPAHSYRM